MQPQADRQTDEPKFDKLSDLVDYLRTEFDMTAAQANATVVLASWYQLTGGLR